MNIIVNLLLIFIFIASFRNARRTTLKFTHRMLAVYIGGLLLATGLVPFVTSDASSLEQVDELDANRAWSDLNIKLSEGRVDQVDARYLLNEKNIAVEPNDFVQLHYTDNDNVLVYVERKKENDGKIEALVFAEGLWIGGYDFFDQLEPLRVSLQPDNRLFIAPTRQQIKVGLITKDFPLRQITGEHEWTHVTSGSQVVYLRIPIDLSIASSGNINVQMVR